MVNPIHETLKWKMLSLAQSYLKDFGLCLGSIWFCVSLSLYTYFPQNVLFFYFFYLSAALLTNLYHPISRVWCLPLYKIYHHLYFNGEQNFLCENMKMFSPIYNAMSYFISFCFPFTFISCAIDSRSERMSPRFFVPRTFLVGNYDQFSVIFTSRRN